jgi:hypothetical protein
MADYYSWFVLLHLLGLVLFVASHGASMFAAFALRQQKDPRAVASTLAVSQRATRLAYVGLLLLIVGGVLAASSTNLWGQAWIIWSVIVLIAVLISMYSLATPYYIRLRQTVGDGLQTGTAESPTVDQAALTQMLETRRPDLLLLVGGLGIVVLVALMVLKPG